MNTAVGPVVMSVVGDAYLDPAQIASVLWVGTTTAGDRVELRERESGALLWECLTDSTSTYLGKTFGPHGMAAPGGFRLEVIGAGRVLVYLKEP